MTRQDFILAENIYIYPLSAQPSSLCSDFFSATSIINYQDCSPHIDVPTCRGWSWHCASNRLFHSFLTEALPSVMLLDAIYFDQEHSE